MADLPPFPRELLSTAFNGDVRMINAFEELVRQLQDAATAVEEAGTSVATIAGTQFILAAASSAFANGRVLVDGRGITITLADGTATISHPIEVTGGEAAFILTGDTNLILPQTGTLALVTDIPAFFAALATTTSYANDAAAAGGGVPVGGTYRNGSVVQIRIT